MVFISHSLNRFAIRSIAASSSSGILWFLCYMAFPLESVEILGIVLFALIILLHLVLEPLLAISALINHRSFPEHSVTLLLMLLNLSLVLFLFQLIFRF